MNAAKSNRDFQLNEDEAFVRKQYVVQRIGWVLMAALVIAALMGAFGRGPLSHKTAHSADRSLSVEYDRFCRSQAQTELKLTASENSVTGGTLRLGLDRKYMSTFEVVDINPRPERTDLSSEHATLVYRVPKHGGPLVVKLILEPTEPGWLEAAAGIEGKDRIVFKQFVYP